jgi:hypothetical protein
MSASQLLSRSLCFGLIYGISAKWLAMYLGAETGLFVLYKVLRGDFLYSLLLPKRLALSMSLLLRIVAHIITTFTAMLELRHPRELGGAAYFGILLGNQVLCYVAILFYGMSEQASAAFEAAAQEPSWWADPSFDFNAYVRLLWQVQVVLSFIFAANFAVRTPEAPVETRCLTNSLFCACTHAGNRVLVQGALQEVVLEHDGYARLLQGGVRRQQRRDADEDDHGLLASHLGKPQGRHRGLDRGEVGALENDEAPILDRQSREQDPRRSPSRAREEVPDE